MLTDYTVSFLGHRHIDRFFDVERRMLPLIRHLIQTKPFVTFLVGWQGDFDNLASGLIRRVKSEINDCNSDHTLVLPYTVAALRHDEKLLLKAYDDVVVCPAAEHAHPKAAYSVRNAYMIDRADLCVFCVARASGGAYRALRYAEAHKKTILNFADPDLLSDFSVL